MKYLTIVIMSITVLLFTACTSNGGIEPPVTPDATETKPALATAVSTSPPTTNDESYPANAPTPEPIESYPGASTLPTPEPYNPYPDQETETSSQTVTDSAYPSEVNLSDVTSQPGNDQLQIAPKPGVPGDSTAITELVSETLSDRFAVPMIEITVVSVEPVEWSDSSLGCAAPGYAYAQVITSGYKITLETGGEEYTYHTDLNSNFVLCGEDGQPVE